MTAPPFTHSYSYGGGVQSTAMLVLAAQGYLPPGPFLFANTGDDSEDSATLDYVRGVAFDYAGTHGIEIEELGPARGQTLRQRMMDPTAVGLREPIPVRGENGKPFKRSCTAEWKIAVVGEWLVKHGASAEHPVTVAIGISTDEYERATSRKSNPYEKLCYPLLTLEHRLAPHGASRDVCARIIADAGLPIPPKSSCTFCPFHRPETWATMAREKPDQFERECKLEDHLNQRRADGGHPQRVFLTRFGMPLRDVFGGQTQLSLLDANWHEDEGYRCGDVCDT